MTILLWSGFTVLIAALLAHDLGVFHRKPRDISLQEAFAWTGFWIALAIAFCVPVYYLYEGYKSGLGLVDAASLSGTDAVLQFFTGYLIEKSLSFDNIFVIAMVFAYFKVPLKLQHRVLFWGILGALIFRVVMIPAGAFLLDHVSWTAYIFGGILMISAVRLLIARHDNLALERGPVVRLAKWFFPMVKHFEGTRFFTKIRGKRAITPLFLVLSVVAATDALFAVDAVPAIFTVTDDPFLVIASNVFAVLGLRSLYFALAGMMVKFRYLKMSLAFVVAFVGISMLLKHNYQMPTPVTLAVVIGTLSVGIFASVIASHRDTAALISPLANEVEGLAILTLRHATRIIILIIGSTLLLIGGALLVLPGPGLITILVGLTILATQFIWARKLLEKIRKETGQIEGKVKKAFKNLE